jgi:pimeloyl-ACP methyl ester carboxylesterase
MECVELSAGPIEYEDTGDGPVVVLAHGLIQDATLWRKVVPRVAPAHRCVVPTWPLGSHRLPMRPAADLSLHGQARLLAELMDALELSDVTLVQNDWGGALVLAADGPTDRLARR